MNTAPRRSERAMMLGGLETRYVTVRAIDIRKLEQLGDDLADAVDLLRRADGRLATTGCPSIPLTRKEVAELHELVGVALGRLKALGVPVRCMPSPGQVQ